MPLSDDFYWLDADDAAESWPELPSEQRPGRPGAWGWRHYDSDSGKWVRNWNVPAWNDDGLYNPMRAPFDAMLIAAIAGTVITGTGVIVYYRRRDWLRLGICTVLFGGCIWGLTRASSLHSRLNVY